MGNEKKIRIVLTGGGTAGHVTSNLALLPRLRQAGWEVRYIGSYRGIEKELIEADGVPYTGIDTGKFRRYKDLKNLTDPFRVLHGLFQARKILKKTKANVLFSKGGFVAVPVVWAAWSLGIPVVSHESDMTPGLANRLTMNFVKRICCSFPETVSQVKGGKAILTGAPIRKMLLTGSREAGLCFLGFSGEKPVLMIIGGSLGAVAINEAVRHQLPMLLRSYDIVHICGKGNLEEKLRERAGYRQLEYAGEELRHIYACADLAISRAGANVICELLALHIPNLLIPLPRDQSRGDQILNAESFRKQGFSLVLDQHEMEKDERLLLKNLGGLYENRQRYRETMAGAQSRDSVEQVFEILDSVRRG